MIIKSSFLWFSLRVNRSQSLQSWLRHHHEAVFFILTHSREATAEPYESHADAHHFLIAPILFFFRINFDIWPPIFTELLTDLIAQVQFCCPILWKLSCTDISHPISEYSDSDLLIACKNIQNSRLLKAIFFLNKDIRLFFATNWLIWGSKEILLVLNLLAVMSCLFHVVCVGP